MSDVAEIAFQEHDFDNDSKWITYRENLNSTTSELSSAVLNKFKRKYFQRYINAELKVAPATPSGNASTFGSTGAAAPAPSPAPASGSAPPPASAARPPAPAPAPPPAAARPFRQVLMNDIISTKAIQFVANVYFVLNFFFSLIPIGDWGQSAYTQAVLCSLITYLVSLSQEVWPIRFNKEWLARVGTNMNAHYMLYCLSALSMRPMILTLGPLLIFAVFNIATFLASVLPSLAPGLHRKFAPLHQKLIEGTQPALSMVAQLEIGLAFLLIVNWFMGYSSIVNVLMAWQFVRLRYMFSQHTRMLFGLLDQKITGITQSRFCPGLVRMAYNKFKSLLAGLNRTA